MMWLQTFSEPSTAAKLHFFHHDRWPFDKYCFKWLNFRRSCAALHSLGKVDSVFCFFSLSILSIKLEIKMQEGYEYVEVYVQFKLH